MQQDSGGVVGMLDVLKVVLNIKIMIKQQQHYGFILSENLSLEGSLLQLGTRFLVYSLYSQDGGE